MKHSVYESSCLPSITGSRAAVRGFSFLAMGLHLLCLAFEQGARFLEESEGIFELNN